MKMSNKTYDTLVWVAQIFLPALATLCVGLSKLWCLQYGAEIGGTIMLFDVFLGSCLMISNVEYKNRDFEAEGLAELLEAEKAEDYVGEKFGGVDNE